MSKRNYLALLALVPAMAWAQSPAPQQSAAGGSNPVNPEILSKKDPVRTHPTVPSQGPPSIADPSLRDPAGTGVPNALTMQVIMAQKHTGVSDAQWRKMMLEPVNATLYPIRLTQAMLDTLDATQLDIRYRYEMVR